MEIEYVLVFSNNSFQKFIKGIINIDIYEGEGYKKHCSKPSNLRQVLNKESNIKVSRLILTLLNYYENYKLKENNLLDCDKKKIFEI